MKKYKVFGGGEIDASSNLSLITQMRDQSFTPSVDHKDFMRQVAERCKTQKDVVVRYDSYENFVADLLEHKFLEELPG